MKLIFLELTEHNRFSLLAVRARMSIGARHLAVRCCSAPGDSLQPEAIGAVMEVTKWLKPSNSGHNR